MAAIEEFTRRKLIGRETIRKVQTVYMHNFGAKKIVQIKVTLFALLLIQTLSLCESRFIQQPRLYFSHKYFALLPGFQFTFTYCLQEF